MYFSTIDKSSPQKLMIISLKYILCARMLTRGDRIHVSYSNDDNLKQLRRKSLLVFHVFYPDSSISYFFFIYGQFTVTDSWYYSWACVLRVFWLKCHFSINLTKYLCNNSGFFLDLLVLLFQKRKQSVITSAIGFAMGQLYHGLCVLQ